MSALPYFRRRFPGPLSVALVLGPLAWAGEAEGDEEINYPARMKVLVRLGYGGCVAHEWIPQGDARREFGESVASGKV